MKTKIWIALLALYIVWGSTYLAIRFAVETIPPFFHAGLRFLISGLILVLWRRAAGDAVPTRVQWKSVAIIGTLLLLGGNGLVSFAEQRIASGVAALIVGTTPMWLVLIESLRPNGVKPTWLIIVGLIVGFSGIYLLIGPSASTGKLQFDTIGTVAVIAAAFLWALGSIYSRSADIPKSALMTTGAEMLAGSVPLFLVSLALGEWSRFNIAQVSTESWLGLIYLITFGSMVGFVAYIWLLQNAPISLVATYAYVNPLVAVLLGAWFASEPLTSRTLAAAGIIIGSVIFINWARQVKVKKKPLQSAPSGE
ncbi:MAG: EamA family transporter [Anaerolineae bacterium]|nr:EamA family transporter [Anaerolineae bacterium]MBL8107058.1 EamA family transporter [Anaerolineales bacterium]MCC7191007.1 EamA family transporter [Anaerolineales bacterium]